MTNNTFTKFVLAASFFLIPLTIIAEPTLEEIVVSARKVDENLQDVPIASLPKTYIHKEGNLYNQLLDISCFVASLTDGNALEWYNKIS